jgi:hypothetical protein
MCAPQLHVPRSASKRRIPPSSCPTFLPLAPFSPPASASATVFLLSFSLFSFFLPASLRLGVPELAPLVVGSRARHDIVSLECCGVSVEETRQNDEKACNAKEALLSRLSVISASAAHVSRRTNTHGEGESNPRCQQPCLLYQNWATGGTGPASARAGSPAGRKGSAIPPPSLESPRLARSQRKPVALMQ